MAGPWINTKDNPGFLRDRHWKLGDIIEAVVYDSSKKDQKKSLWLITGVSESDDKGKWLQGNLAAVEDQDLKWWLTKGGGKEYHRDFKIHICSHGIGRCKAHNSRAKDEFHLDYLRMLTTDDLKVRRALWWQTGVAKSDFEAFRKDVLGTNSPVVPGALAEAEALDVDFGGSEELAEGVPGDANQNKVRDLEKQLAALKRDAGGGKASKKDKKDRKERKAKEGEKAVKAAPAGGKKTQGWFGKKEVVKHEAEEISSESRGRKKAKRKKRDATSSPSREKGRKESKRKKEKDRGPYGIGEKMDFNGVDEESDSSSSDESVFHKGASDKVSHQLRLVEYAQKRPGRLTSRLLVKMQSMLARDTGAPFSLAAQQSTLTPPSATPYLLTVLAPLHKDKMGLRQMRELRTITACLDEIARGNPQKGGDILSQRLKALELQMADGGWSRAQYLELISPEGATLAERSEQAMASKEQAQEARMRQALLSRSSWSQEPKGKGDGKSKGKGKKGNKKGWNQNAENQDKPPPS